MKEKSNCIICGDPLRGRQRKYCSITCKNKALQSYPAQKRRGLTRKLQLVKTLGGRCSICGYDQNISALTFHHTDPNKEFKLDMRSLSNRTLKAVLTEVEKCILVCQNCHAELHNPHLDLATLSSEAGCSNH